MLMFLEKSHIASLRSKISNNGHTTKNEKTRTADRELFHINAHGLRPTTNHESFDMAMLINSFQIKSLQLNCLI